MIACRRRWISITRIIGASSPYTLSGEDRGMDSEGGRAARLLGALWEIRQRLWELEVRLWSAPEVTSARSTANFRRYSECTPPERCMPWVEYCLWAELGGERDITAWLGVHSARHYGSVRPEI